MLAHTPGGGGCGRAESARSGADARRRGAGERLMGASDRTSWNRVVAADRLERDHAAALERYAQVAAKTGEFQLCRVMVGD